MKILKDWNNLIIQTNPSVLMISQYKSYYYQSNNILIPDRLSYEILQNLKSIYQHEDDVSLILKEFHQNP